MAKKDKKESSITTTNIWSPPPAWDHVAASLNESFDCFRDWKSCGSGSLSGNTPHPPSSPHKHPDIAYHFQMLYLSPGHTARPRFLDCLAVRGGCVRGSCSHVAAFWPMDSKDSSLVALMLSPSTFIHWLLAASKAMSRMAEP